MLASRSSALSAHHAVPGAAVSMPRRAHSVASASSSSSSTSAASAASALSLTTAAHQLAAAALAASRRHGPASRSATALAAAASSSAAAAAAAAAAASAAAAVAAAASGGGSSGRSAAAAAPVLAPEVAEHFPNGEFSVHMQVRDYELDQFSVVNNAVYSSFLQHGRHEAFAALGHDVDEYARAGTPLALSQLNIAFKAPLRSRDRFRVTVTVSKVSGARLVLQQRVLRRAGKGEEEELVAEAEATVVFLDSSYRAARVPKEVTRLFQALVDLRTQAAGGSGR